MMNAREILAATAVMPVIVIDELEDAVPLAKALVNGGIKVLEVTLRSPVALEAIRRIKAEVPEAIVGVGSVKTAKEWAESIEAGAVFGVSPGTSAELRKAISESDVPFIPGVATPSEAMTLAELGFDTLKLFPATVVGGVPLLKAISGPLPDLVFCPTGGVSPSNAKEFLALPNVACVGGSWMISKEDLANKRWDSITEAAVAAVSACSL